MRFGSLLALGGAGLAGWYFGRRGAALLPPGPSPAAPGPVAALIARSEQALGEARRLAELSRRLLAESDVAGALQRYENAWWELGAAAMLASHAQDLALAGRIRAAAVALSADGYRFEDLAARGLAVEGKT